MIKLTILMLVVATLVILGLGGYLGPNDLRSCQSQPTGEGVCQSANAIIAVSGGNTSIRAAEAIELYHNNWAEYMIFSGAAKDTTGPSNAEAMRRQAIAAGIPEANIIIDDAAQSTHQNAEKTAEIVRDRNFSRVILVTSPYHQRRASIDFNHIFDSSVTIVNHPAANDPDWPSLWWLTPRGWWLATGETVKIIYSQLGGTP